MGVRWGYLKLASVGTLCWKSPLKVSVGSLRYGQSREEPSSVKRAKPSSFSRTFLRQSERNLRPRNYFRHDLRYKVKIWLNKKIIVFRHWGNLCPFQWSYLPSTQLSLLLLMIYISSCNSFAIQPIFCSSFTIWIWIYFVLVLGMHSPNDFGQVRMNCCLLLARVSFI